jgi:hypothetical protein
MLQRDKAEAVKNQLLAASFTAWQMLLAKGEKREWQKYASDLGLVEKARISKEERAAVAQAGYSRAEQIARMDRGK